MLTDGEMKGNAMTNGTKTKDKESLGVDKTVSRVESRRRRDFISVADMAVQHIDNSNINESKLDTVINARLYLEVFFKYYTKLLQNEEKDV